MSAKILSEVIESILTLTLNRPEKLNCLDQEMLDMLDEQVARAEGDAQVRAVVLRGAEERAFSSGANLKAFRELDTAGARQWIVSGNRLFNRIERLPKPTVALIQGYALGGGLELALACDFRIATETAVFSCPELQNGWLPGWGGMARLRRLLGEAKAKEVVLLGQKIGAEEAQCLGLLTQLTTTAELESTLSSMTDKLLKVPLTAYALAKSVLMDEYRTTDGADLLFDVLALHFTNS